MAERLVLFSDLDGALLDANTYSWRGAEEALEEIARRKIPLIFCTSKTRAEVEYLRAKMGNRDPFITENGGGIFVPYGYFNLPMKGADRAGHNHGFALGRPYAEIVEALEEISAESGTSVAGFHSMNAREIAANTGLSLEMAQLAAKREFDEPFFFAASNPKSEQKFLDIARERGLGVARGDRFWHLFSGSDKGRRFASWLIFFASPSTEGCEWRRLVRARTICRCLPPPTSQCYFPPRLDSTILPCSSEFLRCDWRNLPGRMAGMRK